MKEKNSQFDLYADTASITSSELDEKSVIKQADSDRSTQLGRMVLVIVIPILALTALTIVVIVQALEVRSDANESKRVIDIFHDIDHIVTALGTERGWTAAHLVAQGGNEEAFNTMVQKWEETDKAWRELDDHWLADGWFPGEDLSSRAKVLEYLKNHRARTEVVVGTSVRESLDFYTALTSALMREGMSYIQLPEEGDVWSLVVAIRSLLRAADAIGIQRSLGSTFFTLCEFTTENFVWFSNMEGQSDALITSAFSQHPPSGRKYQEQYVDSELQTRINKQLQQMGDDRWMRDCLTLSRERRNENTNNWHDDMTQYQAILVQIREDLTAELNSELDDIITEAERDFIIYVLVLVIVVVVCLCLATWYALRINKMIRDIIKHAKMSRSKSKELAFEKKKTELLLYEMLPRSVADDLKTGREVRTETFDNVSIVYLDIVGFVAMISKLTPIQVVELLNALYGMFDDETERFNVYKMEQSNDVYGVVSGVPVRTASHAAEIANLTVHLIHKIHHFRLSSMPGIIIKVRAGAHSGSCAAGVVGTKTPRYSIFGESVKMASRMSRSSDIMKIQISENMMYALRTYGSKYLMVERGEIEVYGKGTMKTFFLEGLTDGLKVPRIEEPPATHF